MSTENDDLRKKILGLGENSLKKSYYPELLKKIDELSLFKASFDKINSLVFIIRSKSGILKYCNDAAKEVFAVPENSENTKHIKEIIHLDFWEHISKLAGDKKEETNNFYTTSIESSNGLRTLEAKIEAIELEGSSFVVAIFRDITERIKREKQIQKQNEELKFAKQKIEESDALKSAFLSNLSHEIRTPMNGILGYANLISHQGLDHETITKYAEIINRSGTQLMDVITDLLDYSKIEAKQVSNSKQEIELKKTFQNLYDTYVDDARLKGLLFTFKLDEELENQKVLSDPILLEKVMVKLIENALKFTLDGIIEFGCKIIDKGLNFYVKDTGIGIDKAVQESIFDKFRQANAEIAIEYGGTGLGLAIANSYVEMLGGSISVKSELGTGSEFYFSIDYDPQVVDEPKAEVSLETSEKEQSLEGKVILIAEDEEMVFLYLKEILRKQGLEILHAQNGALAVKMYHSHPEIDLILMDIKMPVLNGYEATVRIREEDTKIPIVAQTAYSITDTETKRVFSDILNKPIAETRLIQTIKRLLLR